MEYYTCHLLVVLLNDVTFTIAVIISENLKLIFGKRMGSGSEPWFYIWLFHMSCQVSIFALLCGITEVIYKIYLKTVIYYTHLL